MRKAILVLLLLPGLGWGETPDAGSAGTWSVTETVSVRYKENGDYRFLKQTLPIEVTVASDGTVTGSVGSAHFEGCRVVSNRNALERWLNLKTDWIFRGQLVGRLFPGDPFALRKVSAPFNRTGEAWSGTLFHMDDWEGFPMADLALTREPPIPR